MDLQQNNPTLAELEGHESWSYEADLLGFSLRSFHGHRVWVLPPVCVLGSGETPFTWTSSVLLFTLPSCPDSASDSLLAHKSPPNHILASGVPCQSLPHLVPKLSEGQKWWGGVGYPMLVLWKGEEGSLLLCLVSGWGPDNIIRSFRVEIKASTCRSPISHDGSGGSVS